MNGQRFFSMPNALKPLIVLFILLTIIFAASSSSRVPLEGGWFFWLSIIIQMVFMSTVCGLFVYEAEDFLGCGRTEGWPVVEMSYSGVGVFCNLLNTFILAHGHKGETSGGNSFVVAAFISFCLCVFYAIGGLMMFGIWRGFVKSGTSQNPTSNVQPGTIGSMHPGV